MTYIPGPGHANAIEAHRYLLTILSDLHPNDPAYKALIPQYRQVAATLATYERVKCALEKEYGEVPHGSWVDQEYVWERKAEQGRKLLISTAAVVLGVACAPIASVMGAVLLPVGLYMKSKDVEAFQREREAIQGLQAHWSSYTSLRMSRESSSSSLEKSTEKSSQLARNDANNVTPAPAAKACNGLWSHIALLPITVVAGAVVGPLLAPVIATDYICHRRVKIVIKGKADGA